MKISKFSSATAEMIVIVFICLILGSIVHDRAVYAADFDSLEYLNSSVLTYVTDAAVSGATVYASNPNGLLIMDFIAADNPDTLAFLYIPEGCHGLAKRGNYVFIVGGDQKLITVDVTVPGSPERKDDFIMPGSIKRLFIESDRIYAAGGYGNFYVVEIADPLTPALAGEHLFSDEVRDIAISGNLLLAACDNDGLQIVDISNISSIDSVGAVDTPGSSWGIEIIDDYAFIADNSNGLVVIDFSTPSSPFVSSTYNDQNVTTIQENYPYLYIGNSTEIIITMHDTGEWLDTLGTLGITDGYPLDIEYQNDFLYMTMSYGIFRVADIFNTSSPSYAGGFQSRRFVQGVYVRDSLAYVTDYNGGLFIVDYRNPESLVEVGSYPGMGGAEEIILVDSLAVISRWAGGITILNVKDPASPSFVGSYTDINDPENIHLFDSLVYIARMGAGEGVHVINISDPSNPQFVAEYVTPDLARSVFVNDTVAYVAADDSGLIVISFADPLNPEYISDYVTSSRAYSVSVSGDMAYVGQSNGLVTILNISDPSTPVFVNSHDIGPSNVTRIEIVDNFAFIAAGRYLSVVDMDDPLNPEPLGTFENTGRFIQSLAIDDHIIALAAESGLLFLLGSSDVTSVDHDDSKGNHPAGFELDQNYPNPFNPATTIRYYVDRYSEVRIDVYNVLGQCVRNLLDEYRTAGYYTITWDGMDGFGNRVASGIYFYNLVADDMTASKKMLLLR